MRSAWVSRLFLTGIVATALFGCNDDDKQIMPEPTPVAGKGGSATVYVSPMHNGVRPDSFMVYLKYNSDAFPTQFDDSAKCYPVDGKSTATFTNLKRGQYFIYGRGWDIIRSQTVAGSRSYYVDKDNTVYTVDFPVAQAK